MLLILSLEEAVEVGLRLIRLPLVLEVILLLLLLLLLVLGRWLLSPLPSCPCVCLASSPSLLAAEGAPPVSVYCLVRLGQLPASLPSAPVLPLLPPSLVSQIDYQLPSSSSLPILSQSSVSLMPIVFALQWSP
ncbi:hypothetical protein PHYPSEUDO_010570 [Phytophthora pseudosyringae]|uniref:Uncharacterized protein n=1 Tax=Phytophthora pseudosyringae TaxID=221518 RepID=A0A8T1VDE4_9STRA|nr:hypothetical protein PHYPSEUDO_010570 [Phytophthora pseudosyringae]